MKFRKALTRVISGILAVVMAIPSSIPTLSVMASSTDGEVVSISSGPEISIEWVDDDFKNGSSYNLVEDSDTVNVVKLKVSYSDEKVIEEGYDAGELVLTVKGIGNVDRSSIIEATVGADKASDGTKNRD